MSVTKIAERKTCQVGSASIPYAEYGERRAGTSPVCVIGGLSTNPEDSWGDFLKDLNRKVYAFGFPDGNLHPIVPTLLGLARFTGRAMKKVVSEEYGPGVRPDIGGWSLGGAAAQAAVLRSPLNPFPIKARRLFILASYPLGVPLQPFIPSWENLSAPLSLMRTKRDGLDHGAMYGGKVRHDPETHASIKHLLEREIEMVPHLRQLFAALGSGALAWPNVYQTWTGMTTVSEGRLCVNARDDPIIMAGAAEGMAASIGMRSVMLPEGGHLFPVLEPEAPQIVADFLDRAA